MRAGVVRRRAVAKGPGAPSGAPSSTSLPVAEPSRGELPAPPMSGRDVAAALDADHNGHAAAAARTSAPSVTDVMRDRESGGV